MAGFCYHIKGLGNNKEIKEQRKKPLPLLLMKVDKDDLKRVGDRRARPKDSINPIENF